MSSDLNDNRMEKTRKLQLLVSSVKNEPSALLASLNLACDSVKLFTSSGDPEQFAAAASTILGTRGLKAENLSFDGANAASKGEKQ